MSNSLAATVGASNVTPDFWDRLGTGVNKLTADPIFKLGMSLMARGGPSKNPHSFGQDLAGAFSDMTESQSRDREDKRKQMELEDYEETRGRRKKYGEEMDKLYPSLLQSLLGEAQTTAPPNLQPAALPPQPQPQMMPPEMTQATAPAPAPVTATPLGPPQRPQMPAQQFTQGGQGGFAGVPDISPEYFTRLAGAESGGKNLGAHDPSRSSAWGKFGFTEPTWKDWAADPNDRSEQAQLAAMQKFTKANVDNLRMSGLPVNDANAYAMHVLGPGDGPKFLKVSDDTPVAQVVAPRSVKANPELLGRGQTVGQVKQAFAQKVGAGSAGTGVAQAAEATPVAAKAPAETLQEVMGLPPKQKKQILLGAMLASQGDPDKFMAHVGQSMLQLAEAKAKADDRETWSQPINIRTEDGREIAVQTSNKGNYKEFTPGTRTSIAGGPKFNLDKLTPDEKDMVEYQTEIYRKTGKLPTGRTLDSLRTAIMKNASRQAKAEGNRPIFDMISQYGFKADGASLTNLTKQADAFHQFEGTLLRNMKRVEHIMPEGGIGPSGIPLLDRYVNAGREAILGDPEVPEWNAAIITVIDEYAKLMTGSLGNTPTSDAARAQVAKMLRDDMNSGQIENVFNTIRADAANRQQSVLATKTLIEERMSARGAADTTEKQRKANAAGLDKEHEETKLKETDTRKKSKSGRWMFLNAKGQWEYED